MRRLRHHQLEAQISAMPELRKDRVPKPFPGKSAPTRVGWTILANFGRPGYVRPGVGGEPLVVTVPREIDIREHTYIGKPCRFRALEALNFLGRAQRQGQVMAFWQTEYDSAGPVCWTVGTSGPNQTTRNCDAYYAYHPQGGDVNPMAAFAKPVYVKRIGQFSTYSHQKKLSQEQIDQFYAWWEERFNPLKRPKKRSAKAEKVAEAPLAPEPIIEAEPTMVFRNGRWTQEAQPPATPGLSEQWWTYDAPPTAPQFQGIAVENLYQQWLASQPEQVIPQPPRRRP